MYRTVTDGPDGYVYGQWTTKDKAFDEAELIPELTWVEDEEHNRVS